MDKPFSLKDLAPGGALNPKSVPPRPSAPAPLPPEQPSAPPPLPPPSPRAVQAQLVNIAPVVLSTDSAQIAGILEKAGFIGLAEAKFQNMTMQRSSELSVMDRKTPITTTTVSVVKENPSGSGVPRKIDFSLKETPAIPYISTSGEKGEDFPAKREFRIDYYSIDDRKKIRARGDPYFSGGFENKGGKWVGDRDDGFGENRIIGELFVPGNDISFVKETKAESLMPTEIIPERIAPVENYSAIAERTNNGVVNLIGVANRLVAPAPQAAPDAAKPSRGMSPN